MKKSELRQIIREEIEKELNEQNYLLNEDLSMQLLWLLQAAAAAGISISAARNVAASMADNPGRGFHPIEDLKAWWARRKKDKAVQSIVNKLKDDPEVKAFMSQSQSSQRGKWYKLIEPKLSGEEKQYLRSITKTQFEN